MTRIHDPVLAHEWFPVARSSDIGNSPHKVTLMGEDIVLFRTDDGISALRDLCIHRGAALSLGQVVDNNIICPYHGWQYSSSGACVRIPAQAPGASIPTKARAQRYPLCERYGFVWVALEEPQAPVPPYPEWDDPSFHSLICGPYSVHAEGPRIIENFLDVSHLMWVHEGLLGVPTHAEIPDHNVHSQGGRLVSDPIRIYQPDPDGRGKVVDNQYVYEVLRPFTARFRKTDPASDETFSMMMLATPVGHRETLAYAVLSRNYSLETPDETFIEFQDRLLEQDKRIVESQRPEDLPLDLQAELHLKSDRIAIAYRRYLAELGVKIGVA